ncbi:MAG: hypothetical protein ACJAZ3_001948 [Sphingobacteriales bacterium]|jgi:hypothetical protein
MKNNFSKHVIKVFVVLLTGTFVFVVSCKKEEPTPCPVVCEDPSNPDCPNYDPCYSVEEVTADFDILEQIAAIAQWADSFTVASEVSSFGLIKFKAKQENALHYTWYIGSEIITDVEEVARLFSQPNLVPGKVVSITLVVEAIPNLDCFPNDDGIDTVTKVFTLVEPCEYWVDGTFRGAWSDEQSTDSFDVRFSFSGVNCYKLHVWNLTNQLLCDSSFAGDVIPTNSTLLTFEPGTICAEPFGSIVRGQLRYNINDNSATIDYVFSRWDSASQTVVDNIKVFKGFKIN